MAEVYVDEKVQEALDLLYEDDPRVVERIEDSFERLAQDPGNREFRARLIRREAAQDYVIRAPIWGYTIRGREADYTVLWEQAQDGAAEVRFVGELP